ncbi:Cytochrome c biogenesis protein CcdA [Methanolobus vulcani]|uniref:Cytochrome c biogenesis protein CcdA n=1 Tax=Methanolobus vulcani TaxID=38026 RepID=A0A7Z7FBV9_9EURY|nr:cytochrome c biogenesis protein CcdA [Methanolobus vulcani]SDF50397.1 Cytochrome c biogenesis protein CcdA [Methanolobus vulcani]
MIKRPVHRHPVTERNDCRFLLAFFFSIILLTGLAQAAVSVEYFYEDGCLKCAQASPVIEDVISSYPDTNFSSYEIKSAFSLAKSYGVTTVPAIVVNGSTVISYNDYEGDTGKLSSMLSEAIETAPVIDYATVSSKTELISHESLDDQTPAVIFIAGLLAGFNPCLIAVMAFLASAIVSSGGSRKDMLVLVIGFCAGIFVTYMIVGFGILNTITSFPGIKDLITKSMIFLVAIFGFWHLYDAYYIKKYSKSSFKTPHSFVDLMDHARGKNILLISFVGGGIFSLVKAPCVGAVYLMILEMLLSGGNTVNAVLYMGLYNFAVILPILILGALLAFGLDPEKVNEFREKRRVEVRLITGLILILLAALLQLNII